MPTAIVSDSTCDLPASLAAQNKISIVNNAIVMDGKSYEDGKDLTREEFYTMLPGLKSQPTTATAAAGVYEKLYESLFANGADEIISIHLAASLSGVFNAARLGAQRFGEKVKIFDTGMLSMGVGFIALQASRLAAQGLSASQILVEIAAMQPRVRLYAMLDTLEFIRRSGRVSWAQARLGGLLGLRPFLEVREGKVNSLGEARTRTKGIERLYSLLAEVGPLEQLAILHTNAPAEAQMFYEKAIERLAVNTVQIPPLLINVTTAIGTHVGPNALGFVAVRRVQP